MTDPIPDYRNLDLSGEARQAASRMEARARAAASQAMFNELVAPLLTASVRTVLEFGCGTAALSRRMARAAPRAAIYATDKSEGMLQAARHMVETEGIRTVQVQYWDVLDAAAFPFPAAQFDLIISSVVVPYLDDGQVTALIHLLASHLAPGGTLAFIEQDWMSDMLYFPRFELVRKILGKDQREVRPALALGLRPILRAAGLRVLPRRSFLWTDDAYNDYTRDLLERFADSAYARGQILPEERDEWKQTLAALAALAISSMALFTTAWRGRGFDRSPGDPDLRGYRRRRRRGAATAPCGGSRSGACWPATRPSTNVKRMSE